MNYADFTSNLEGQKMFQILAQAKELESAGKKVIHLEIGDPDFNSPDIAKETLKKCLDKNITHYVQSSGLPELKEASREATLKSRGFAPTNRQLLVTSGANIQLYLIAACILNTNDEIIIQDPSFVSYSSIIKSCRGIPRLVPLYEKDNFKIEPALVEKLINKRTKAIIINSPHNPTGSVLEAERIKALFNICQKHGIYLISDEVYGRMIFEDSNSGFFSPTQLDQCKETTILVHSFSKTYAMTGWRIGAVTGPEELIRRMSLLFETITSCVPPFIQLAAAEVLRNGSKISKKMIQEYQERRDILVNGLNSIDGIKCLKPEGTFYAFANTSSINLSSKSFSENLLKDHNIATCPGVYFGKQGEGFVRFCFATSKSEINDAIERMKKGIIQITY